MQSALLSLHIIHVFQMTGLLRRKFFNEQETKYVSVYLNKKPQNTGEDWDFFRPCGVE